MSEVRLTVGGRDYTVACAEGEEAHVARLGEALDAKLQQLGGNLSPKEAQNLLFAGLLLADEAHELRASETDARDAQAKAERERDEARSGADAATAASQEYRGELEKVRAELAELRAERDALAVQLEEAADAPPAANGIYDDPGLPPALERFADLLENCADKLEGKAQAS